LTTQLPKRAFIAKHLNIGSGAARPATPDTTSSGKAWNGDFTNTAHQRSTRQTIAFAQSCGKLQWELVSKTDENGNFILEACGQPNMKMARHFLEWQCPEQWGKRWKRNAITGMTSKSWPIARTLRSAVAAAINEAIGGPNADPVSQ
jgi:hypothetical protein